MPDASPIRRTATAAIAGGLLVATSVAAELVHPVQAADGTSREPVLHAFYLAASIVGWALVAAMAVGLRGVRTQSGGSRMATVGSWLGVVGAAAFVVSNVGLLVGVVAEVYPEALFVLVLVALPLLVVGLALLGLAIRRTSGATTILLLVAAAGLLVALLAEAPIHDIGLLGGALAMAGTGGALLTTDVGRTDGSLV